MESRWCVFSLTFELKMGATIDLTGKEFGNLTVIRRVISKTTFIFWYCKCACGGEAVVAGNNLRGGHTKSCGCLLSEITKSRNTTHGLRTHPIYRTWSSMIERCTREGATSYKRYGAVGVKVCKEWYDFKTFYDWAIANGWERGMNVDKDIIPKKLGIPALLYSPEMCCIVTVKENNRHRVSTKLTIGKADEIRTSKEKTTVLMKKYGVGRTTIQNIKTNKSWI
jgi:hypothetical protein